MWASPLWPQVNTGAQTPHWSYNWNFHRRGRWDSPCMWQLDQCQYCVGAAHDCQCLLLRSKNVLVKDVSHYREKVTRATHVLCPLRASQQDSGKSGPNTGSRVKWSTYGVSVNARSDGHWGKPFENTGDSCCMSMGVFAYCAPVCAQDSASFWKAAPVWCALLSGVSVCRV
jgi:hypothetical protein